MISYQSGNAMNVDSSIQSSAVYNKHMALKIESSRSEPYSYRIGSGDDAKSSVVWFVITFTLTLYACLIAVLIIVDIFNNKGIHILDNVKESWSIFTPIITLSLGYMFGKVESKSVANVTNNDK